jgi:ABC-type dipeptide/oligopeptide/nickel transport system permease component
LLIDSLLAGRLDVFTDALRHLILPAFTLSLGGLATITRFTRAGVLETLQKDFVTYERAQGFPPRALIGSSCCAIRWWRPSPDRPAIRRPDRWGGGG